MKNLSERYIEYVSVVRRYSDRTVEAYADSLEQFFGFLESEGIPEETLNARTVRAYEVWMLDAKGLAPSTVSNHLSILSGFCRFLLKQGLIPSNPVKLVQRPKTPKRLPLFYREESMRAYFSEHSATLEFGDYDAALRYFIVSLLYETGIRRAELISLRRSQFDAARSTLRVRGKGDKEREIPLTGAICEEILLYLRRVDSMFELEPDSALLVNAKGRELYPVFVDRAVKRELSEAPGITVRRSPHVLRHTLASELLDDGADLNSIKELLGHSSLAATQIYTHNSVEKLKNVYSKAHPRAKSKTN